VDKLQICNPDDRCTGFNWSLPVEEHDGRCGHFLLGTDA